MKKIKKRPTLIRFLDHCQYTGSAAEAKPVECEVMGYVAHEDPLYIVVLAWVAENDANNQNNECYVILKSTIIEKRAL